MKKSGFIITAAILVSAALFLLNMFFGNPISKTNAEKITLQYYEDSYGEKFTVYGARYNSLIPAYVFELGPVSDPNIKFQTGLFSQNITDEYGGILAAHKLSEDVAAFLRTEYGRLNYEVSGVEEPLVSYAGESPDYFETDPYRRVLTNHFKLTIAIADGVISPEQLTEAAAAMAELIEIKLPYQTPNLRVQIKFKADLAAGDSDKKAAENTFLLFSTAR